MTGPPPSARTSGVLFERRAVADVQSAQHDAVRSPTAPEKCPEISSGDDAQLFGFESELEPNLTYIPLAVRFKLDRCGIKLSLEAWQQLPEFRRLELFRMRCHDEEDLADFRKALCVLVSEYAGEEPASMVIAEHPPWAEERVPDQLARAATALGFAAPSLAQWRKLSAVQRFALLKLSREGREHRNLGAALREFGLL